LIIGGYLYTARDRIKDEFDRLGNEQGGNASDLSVSSKARAIINVLGADMTNMVNKAFDFMGIQYKLDPKAMANFTGDIAKRIDNDFSVLRSNLGSVGNKVLDYIGNIGSALNKGLESLGDLAVTGVDLASEIGDNFMKQTADHKKFIALVKKMRRIKGVNNVLKDKDKKEYEALQKQATTVAGRLQGNDAFVSKSGFQNDALELLDPKKRAYAEAMTIKSRLDSKTNKVMNFITGNSRGYDAQEKDRKAYKAKYNEYLTLSAKDGTLSKKEKKDYKAMIEAQNQKFLDIKKERDIQKELLANAIEAKSRLEADTKNSEKLSSTIEILAKSIVSIKDKLALLDSSLSESTFINPLANVAGGSDSSFLRQLGMTESKNNYFTGQNANGYEGKYQFRFRKGDHGSTLLKRMGKSVGDFRRSPQVQEELMQEALKDYKRDLRSKNIPINNYTLWLRHNQGLGGASQISKGNLHHGANGKSTVRRNMLNQFGAKQRAYLSTRSDQEVIQAYKNKFSSKFKSEPGRRTIASAKKESQAVIQSSNKDIIDAINKQTEALKQKKEKKRKETKEKAVVAFSPTKAYKDIA